MKPRMANPVKVVPDAMQALIEVSKALSKVGLPKETLDLVHLRIAQINGCAGCMHLHVGDLGKSEEMDRRLLMVAGWREAPYFSDAERAALGLAESVTRLSDRPDPVPDEVWDEAAKHYSEQELGALVIAIGMANLWNRINASTKQVPGGG